MSFGGNNNRWKQGQEDIYRHARGLGIADTPHPWGKDLKEGTEDDLTKAEWKSFTDRLNERKATATAGGTQDFVLGSTDEQKQRSSDWYRTPEGASYAESLEKPVGFGINEGFPAGGGDTEGWATARGGGAPGSANYPMGLVDYQEPSAMSGIPLDFQPWLQPDHIPDSLWNYQAPTLNEWEVERNWDWATKPASEYLTDEQKAAAAAAQIRGDRDIESGVRFSDPYGYRIGGPGADDQLWDYLAQEDEGTTTPFTMDDLNAMSGMPSAQALAQALANENTDDFSAASQVTGAQPYP